MANQLFGNNLKTALSLSTAPGSLSGVATSVTLVAGGGNNWPTPSAGDYFLATLYEVNGLGIEINHEVVRVTNRTADTLTIGARDFELAYSGVGRSFPDVPANNPSGTVFAALRYTAYAAGNTLNKDDNLSSIVNKTTARANLGVAIGTNVQAFSANLSEYAAVNPTPAGLALLDDADNTAQRATLGLGTLATQSGTYSGNSSGTNTGDQNNFNTIAVSGQTSVVADATSDTLTLVAGTNVVITTNAATDAITVSVPNQIAANVTNTPSGNLAATTVQAALNELQTDVDTRATSVQLTAHTGAAAAAHAATAITNTASGNLTSLTVQASLVELQLDIDTRALNSGLTTANTNHTNHLNDTADAHDASAISYLGSTNLVATNVEAALDELDTEKLSNADGAVTNAKLAFDGGALGNRNILINAGFRINNGNAGTPYVSGAALASGQYGHEMWKAGASGGDYSFTQLNTNTQITIASGKSLIQVVEDLNVHETSYVLSWEGTAQARVGVNSATPSGAYASSPILITGQTAGTTMSVEFNTGTLGKAQLEKGSIATPFENKDIAQILIATQRYFWKGLPADSLNFNSYATNAVMSWPIVFPVSMRATPTLTSSFTGIFLSSTSSPTLVGPTVSGVKLVSISTGIDINAYFIFAAGNFLAANARL